MGSRRNFLRYVTKPRPKSCIFETPFVCQLLAVLAHPVSLQLREWKGYRTPLQSRQEGLLSWWGVRSILKSYRLKVLGSAHPSASGGAHLGHTNLCWTCAPPQTTSDAVSAVVRTKLLNILKIMEANARPSLTPIDHRLSPRCLLNGSTSSLSSCLTSRSPFGLSRQPSVSSGGIQHGRQSSSTSAELSQYLPSHQHHHHHHSRQNSNMSCEKSPPIIPPRRPYVMTSPSGGSNPTVVTPPTLLKLSPNSIDMGYHTMVS